MGSVINAQSLFNRVRMWLAGVQFQGQRDLYQIFGYKRLIDYRDFVACYYRQGVAKRVVDAPVLGVWTDPPVLTADNPEFNIAWEDLVEERALFAAIMRFDKLARLGTYAVMVIGFDDGQKLEVPITDGDKKARKVLYMQPYHQAACSIQSYEADSSNPRFGQPTMYAINPGRFLIEGQVSSLTQGQNAAELRQPFNCHHSRLVHIAEGLLEDQVFGTSPLEVVFNDIADILKVTGSSAEAFWLLVNKGMQIDVDKDVDLAPEDAKELTEEVEDYQHQLRRFIRTRGVKVTPLGSDPVSPKECFMVLIQLISMGTGIPQLILLGAAAGQTSSRNDRSNWADRLAERVAEYAGPVVLKRLLDCLIMANVLPNPVNLKISWPEAFKMDPLERAQTSAQMARSAVNLTRAAVHAAPIDANGQPITEGPLFSNDEMRQMVSFGGRPPVFDAPQPSGDTPSPSTPDAPTPGDPSSTPTGGAKPAPKSTVPGPAKTPSKPLGVKA